MSPHLYESKNTLVFFRLFPGYIHNPALTLNYIINSLTSKVSSQCPFWTKISLYKHRKACIDTLSHPFKTVIKSTGIIIVYLPTTSGRINQGIHDGGSEYRSNTVILFQKYYNLFTDQWALDLKRHERGRDRKYGAEQIWHPSCPLPVIVSHWHHRK